VGFTASDEKRLSGRLFGDTGDRTRGVVLLHSSRTDRQSWTPFAEQLMDDGLAVLTLDFRGYGQSDGPKSPDNYPKDVAAAIDTLRVFGVTDIVVAGVEVGGTAAVGLPERSVSAVNGVVLIDSTSRFEKLDVKAEAQKLETQALVISDQGEESDLGELIPDAASETIAFDRDPQASDQIRARIKRFVDDVL
jgi:pimeloyl-ACP methyl ester carboxylesterase